MLSKSSRAAVRIIVIALLGVYVTACQSRYIKYNTVSHGERTQFSNTKLDLSIKFYGDYVFTSALAKEERAVLHHILAGYFAYSKLKPRSAVYYTQTSIAPYFTSVGWYVKKQELNFDAIKKDFVLENPDTFYSKFYHLHKTAVGEGRCWVIRIYPMQENYLLVILYADITKNKTTLETLDQNLLTESDGIFDTLDK